MVKANNKPRVLVVDGYADATDSMALLLNYWGCEVRVAYSAPEALALARLFRPDVVLLELKLDGMDGYQLADRLRAEARGRITLVALTGLGDEPHRRRAREHGFDAFLLKPVEPDRIRRLLGRVAESAETTAAPAPIANHVHLRRFNRAALQRGPRFEAAWR